MSFSTEEINEEIEEEIDTENDPNTRAIIEEMRANGATDTEIVEFLLKVLQE